MRPKLNTSNLYAETDSWTAKQGLFVALEFGNAGAGEILIDSFSLTPNEHILVDSKLNLLKDRTHLETLWFELRELGAAVALMRPRMRVRLADQDDYLAAERLRDGKMEVATSLLLSLSKQGDRRASYKLAYQYECMGRIGAAREFFRLAFDQGLQYSIFDLASSYLLSGDTNMAVSCMRQAEEDDVVDYELFEEICRRSGLHDEADVWKRRGIAEMD